MDCDWLASDVSKTQEVPKVPFVCVNLKQQEKRLSLEEHMVKIKGSKVGTRRCWEENLEPKGLKWVFLYS